MFAVDLYEHYYFTGKTHFQLKDLSDRIRGESERLVNRKQPPILVLCKLGLTL